MSHTDTSLTIAGIVAGSDDFNILLKAVTAAGLDDDLAAANADLTVFAPTDDAFRQLAKDFGFDGDPHDEDAVFDAIAGALAGLAPDGNPIPVLTNVLLYHVSPGAKPLAEVASLNNVPTLLPGATFSPDGTTLVDNEPDLPDPSLVQTDLQAANGIIHVIDRVLIPLDIPGNESNNLVIEAEDFQLSGYKVEHDGDASDDALIKLAENTGSATTVFEGPAGQYDLQIDYFDEIDGSAKIDVLVDGEPVKQIALDQNLGGIFATAENATSITIDGLDLETGSTIELVGHRNGNEFARIDKVTLTPIEPAEPTEPPTIAEVATENGNFGILLKALEAADLTAPFVDPESDLTVFAPTDDAFAQLAKDFGFTGDPTDDDAVFNAIAEALAGLAPDGNPIPVLTNVLLYHVSPEAKLLAEVAALDDVPTLLPGATFSPDGTTLVDNEPDLPDPTLIATDIPASNGVIHVIDRVLIPLDIPGNEPGDTVVEAEDMQLSGYKVEHEDDASGDALIKLASHEGTASTVFDGPSGEYDLKLHYFDEIDGEASIEIYVNDDRVERFRLDQELGGRFASEDNAASITVEGLQLEQGDSIKFLGNRDDFEFARIDKFVLSPATQDDVSPEVIAQTEDALV